MEFLDMPVMEASESAQEDTGLENVEFDRIAFELWQHGSLPELAEANAAELEEVAAHSSCL
jgi:hypothetical protein